MLTQAAYKPTNRSGLRAGVPPDDTPRDMFLGRAKERCVRIKLQESKAVFGKLGVSLGSGVIIETGLVLTNFHLVEEPGQIWVNDHPAEILHIDVRYDLVALKATTRNLSPLRMSTELFQEQPVFYVGNPGDYNKSWADGKINKILPNQIVASTAPLEGFSGAGLYDSRNGALVGLIDSLNGGSFTVALPVRLLLEFLADPLVRDRKK